MKAVTDRYVLSGTLVARTPLLVGDHAPGSATDIIQLRDGQGRPVLPGTSLAGCLQSHLHDLGSDPRFNGYWGARAGAEEGAASRIIIDDAPAASDPHTALTARSGIRIDPGTGSAAAGALYSYEILQRGTSFAFCLEFLARGPDEAADGETLIRDLALLLTRHGIRLGRSTSRGLGHLVLEQPSFIHVDRSSPALLLDSLTVDPGDTAALAAAAADPSHQAFTAIKIRAENGARPEPAPDTVQIRIPWTAWGPVMAKTATVQGTADATPMVELDEAGNLLLVLPGSSLKGSLRSQALRILSTLAGNIPSPGAADLSVIDELFGNDAKPATGPDGHDVPARRGALTVQDAVAVLPYTLEEWLNLWRNTTDTGTGTDATAASTGAPEAGRGTAVQELASTVRALNTRYKESGVWLDVAARTAIDRWTGAAADSMLFVNVEPYVWKPFGDPAASAGAHSLHGWQDLRLDLGTGLIDRRRDKKDEGATSRACLALVSLLLKDLAEGWFTLGFGSTRGYGSVRIDLDTATLSGHALESPTEQTLTDWLRTLMETAPGGERSPHLQAWNTFVAATKETNSKENADAR